jgi:hypothetical protein
MAEFMDFKCKTTSSLKNAFAYSLVKPVSDESFPY